ncbi:MAG TPA: ADP-glyceromanno-heptose 6-epimerase [Elusimicrobia bacterium]|nr:MAG: ADP-glyceromanno-heptose 6-epimerase [Elusimicrobia bacterium GWA2_66_18]OGR71944.1 MAG: ADP-glyceromanno-heptose 6-epimerase [Elusimicrobia bacterium GWC2_65_9]HAZ08989.1 ADP-glyceromanno-heptose 6-epimerase [Elusimicrobiota bacterium]
MRALVTGGAGFVGSNLCWELAARGWDVVALDDFSSGDFENLRGFPGDVVAAGVGDTSYWGPRVRRADAVFHQAAITDTTVMDQRVMMKVNVESFRDLLAWAAKAKVKKVVYASSAGVYGDLSVPMREEMPPKPLNVYGFSKAIMDNVAAQAKGVKAVGLRYFNVFGPREAHKGKAASMIWQLSLQMRAGRRPRIFESGEQFRDFIYVKDVVDANLRAFEKAAPGVYNVCTGRKTDFNGIVTALNAALATSLHPEYFKNPYPFFQNETLGDPAKARKAFGFASQWTVERAVSDYFGSAALRAVGA